MATLATLHRYSFADYLALEEASNTKHEFLGGEIYGMAGGTPEHAALSVAVSSLLREQLRSGSCRVYSSDLRVRVLATGLATYPDVTVVCGPSERDPESPTHVTNPKLLVEVLSASTADYDRGDKLLHYQQIPSLTEVVLVDHEVPRVEVVTRQGSQWQTTRFCPGDTVRLDSVDCRIAVDDVYRAARDA